MYRSYNPEMLLGIRSIKTSKKGGRRLKSKRRFKVKKIKTNFEFDDTENEVLDTPHF